MIGEPVGFMCGIRQGSASTAIALWRRWRSSTGRKSGSRLAAKTASECPTTHSSKTGDPLLQAQAQWPPPDRAIDDRDGARRAAEQERLGQRAMKRDVESLKSREPFIRRAPRRRRRRRTGRSWTGGKGDGEAEDDLDQPPKAARGFAEGQRQAGR